VFVAIDADGHPRVVPPLAPETPDEVRRAREAEIRRAHPLARKEEILAARRVSTGSTTDIRAPLRGAPVHCDACDW